MLLKKLLRFRTSFRENSFRSASTIVASHVHENTLDTPIPGEFTVLKSDKYNKNINHDIENDKLVVSEELKNGDYFEVHNIFTVREMFDANVHLGHKTVALDERMKPFIFGSRLGHTIFDLDITAYYLRVALNFCAHIAYRKGIILFLSQNKFSTLTVENTARECKEYAYARDWRIGTFTDSKVLFQFEIRLPDLCIFLNTKNECGQNHPAIVEAAKNLIPVIGVVDSNCNPNLITYPVPGNDDSPSSISFFCDAFKEAVLRGKKKLAEKEKQ